MKDKIAILLPNLRGGGVERTRLSLADEFINLGYEVEFVLMNLSGELLKEAERKFNIIDLGASRLRNIPFALLKYLKNNRPNFLLAAIWPLSVIAAISVFFSSHRCKVLISEHNNLTKQYHKWGFINWLTLRTSTVIGYRLADSRIAVSMGVLNDISKLSFLSKKKFQVIPNPLRQFPKLEDEAIQKAHKLWSCTRGTRILTVGSLKKQKNHELLLYAFAKIKKNNSRLMIVGEGDNHKSLKSLAHKLDITSKIIFAGFHENPSPFYYTADLFVLSSDYEGFGNVILEALSYGIPVVSTDCPYGPREILDNGKYGVLVPSKNVNALFEGITFQLNSAVNKAYLKSRAKNYSTKIAARKYLQLND